MPSTSTREDPSTGMKGSIARSRSRYKGARPHKPSVGEQDLPSLPSEQRFQEKAPPPTRGRQASLPDHATSIQSPVKSKRRESTKVEVYDWSTPADEMQRKSQRALQSDDHTRNGKPTDNGRLPASVPNFDSYRAKTGNLEPNTYEAGARRLVRQEDEPTTLKKPSLLTKKSFTERFARQTKGSSKEALKKIISAPFTLETPQTTVNPAFDAPVSAVNAGERRVTVICGQSTLWLPVTPSTTSLDILRSANEQLSDVIDLRKMIVVESYKQLGLERPLRKYEHVRDVMNSWDNDAQNALLITSSPTGGMDEDLDFDYVSRVQPGDRSVSIHHSQRPGQWDKRWVTLRGDGQIVVAKKEGSETSNICHLSDFDIYVPTARQQSKKIKPPRKLCFTVKSQQKSSMFMSTVNFVHFFSTNDKVLAASWYKAIQEWRSWYLVNVMGKGQKASESPRKESIKANPRPSVDIQPRSNHGSISIESQKAETSQGHTPQRLPTRNRGAPPISFPKQLTTNGESEPPSTRHYNPISVQAPPRRESEPEPFAATSLLGRTYTQRQKAQQSREATQKQANLAPPMAADANSLPTNGLKRNSSQRRKPKPLVDLTPQYREPPQHARKGRGLVPSQIPAGGLVEIATSPEDALDIPPATTWQRPTTSSGRDHSAGSPARKPSTSPEKGDALFSSGLLAGEKRTGQGGMRTGKGVMTGDRGAKASMLDVSEGSQYASGSLLERVERGDGGGGRRPVVDRAKRREMDVGTGEGV
ncbi:hypothetical protein ACLMJK_001251 [Lecanora helva]